MATHEFVVGPRLRLILTDVSAAVRVSRGDADTTRVEVTGGEPYQKALAVRYDAGSNILELREERPRAAVTVVTAGSGVVVGGGSRVVTSDGVVSSGDATVVSTAGRVVVNGVDVTEQVTGRAPEPPPVVTVVVPEGTDTGADRVLDLTVSGLRGRLRAEVSGRGRLSATEVAGARLTVTGQSRAALRRSEGSLGLTVAGQSRAAVDGRFGDVHLDVSGQARVTGDGSYGQVRGQASGMSRVELSGPVAGQSVRCTDLARVQVGGPARPFDDWDF